MPTQEQPDFGPAEGWEAADQEIDFWQEEKDRKERIKWRLMNGL